MMRGNLLLLVAVTLETTVESVTCPDGARDESQKPAIVADCASICNKADYEGYCVYYPYQYKDRCTGGLTGSCVYGPECTFECFGDANNIRFYETQDELTTSLVNRGLTEFSWTKYNSPMLWYLFLRQNHLSDLPELPSTIIHVDLSENAFTSVPPSVKELPSIITLDISGNTISEDDVDTFPPTLTDLHVHDLKFTRIPKPIATRFANLSTLDLSPNPIEKVEISDLPSTIKQLVMSGTSFATIPKGALPYGIKTVNITNSKLEELPTDLAPYNTMDCINLSRNKLKSANSLKVSILDLSYNQIAEFNGTIRDTTILDLSYNGMATFMLSPEVDTIKVLNLRGNNLTSVPDVIRQGGLQVLDLRDNPNEDYLPSTQEWPLLQRVPVVRMDISQLRTRCSDKMRFQEHMICNPLNPVEDLPENEVRGNDPSSGTSTSSPSAAIDNSEAPSSNTMITVVSVVGAALILLFLVVIFYYRRRSQQTLAKFLDTNNTIASADETMLSQDEVLIRHRLDAHLVQVERILASGMYGEVFLATYQQQQVAVKRLKNRDSSRQQIQQFVNEIKMMASFRFPKIVRFVGVVWTKESDVAVVTEYMMNGDLRTYLDKTRRQAREGWTIEKFRIALDVAEALVYLHSLDPPMIHRDLKSCNLLLDQDMSAALSDFGTTRPIDEDCTMTAEVGTALWMAPEVLAGRRYNQSVDIYSLGVILSELDTHQLPFRGDDGNQRSTLHSLRLMGAVMAGSERVRFLPTCPQRIRELGIRCTEHEPTSRPSTLEVAYELRQLLRQREGGAMSRQQGISLGIL
ncbi:hypothetical protein Poli38472_010892 [Pythium oligandrum]|uniref:Protein kinase domain-containing protein n=1 Tax=Pythium oligandrum TaxID=41045 RepID=A0A8K1FI90_PYTOL|nr:hypothetical protein Poli38472_010892 [Pythium oligandrum]|eukprot:TMW61829.1 hypothetical protein Poli38472_010892 [Pythium oligandrum]